MVAYSPEGSSVATHRWKNPLILSLDLPDPARALAIIGEMRGSVGAFKIGLELFHAGGPAIIPDARAAGGKRIFYDAKLCDIPNTVAGAGRVIGGWGVWM